MIELNSREKHAAYIKGKYVAIKPEAATEMLFNDWRVFESRGCYKVHGVKFIKGTAVYDNHYVYHLLDDCKKMTIINAKWCYVLKDPKDIKARRLFMRPKRRIDLDG